MAKYGKTFLQIVNEVLVRVREPTVATYNETEYSTLIAGLVNQVKSEIEDAWQWHALRDTFSVATTNNVSNYALTDAGANAVIINGWNFTTGQELTRGTVASFNRKFFGVGSSAVQTGSPTEYLKAGLDGNYDISVDVWPVPITGQLDTLKFTVYVPQDDIAADATVPLVPQNVLVEEVVARAQNERGDETSPKPNPSETFIHRELLSNAIAVDQSADPFEMDWEPE